METWLPVPQYEGMYEISNFGNLRSLSRKSKNGRNKKDQLIGFIDSKGYKACNLRKNKKMKRFFIHDLVLLAFVGKKSAKFHVCHNDGNPANANLKNLRYDTPKNNMLDKIKHSTSNRGEKYWCAKLKEHQVLEIYKSTEKLIHLAKKYDVSAMTIADIKKHRSWAWLTSLN